MQKRLAILAITAFVAVVPFPAQPNQATEQKQEPTNQSQPAVLSADSQNKQCGGQADQTKANPNPPNWYASFENADGMLVIVGVLTCAVICWQSWETRKAAKGAQRAADASFAQIEMVKSKERARIIVAPVDLKVQTGTETEPGWYLTAAIKVDNIGISKAYDIKGLASMWVQDTSSPISPPEFLCPWHDEPDFRISAEPGDYVVHVDSKFPVDSQIPELTVGQFVDGLIGSEDGESFTFPKKSIYLQGFVEYETMGARFHREFSWFWHLMDAEYGGTVLDGTSIEGTWTRNDKRENGEHQVN